jgi:hypothetical protein
MRYQICGMIGFVFFPALVYMPAKRGRQTRHLKKWRMKKRGDSSDSPYAPPLIGGLDQRILAKLKLDVMKRSVRGRRLGREHTVLFGPTRFDKDSKNVFVQESRDLFRLFNRRTAQEF